MKKLLFLFLVLMGVAGLMTAPIHPPGVFTLDTALSEYSVHEAVVTSDMVLATQHFLGLPASILALPDRPHGYLIKPMEMVSTEPDYWLRL
jgi:hypothetical protein